MDVERYMQDKGALVNAYLEEYFESPPAGRVPPVVLEAMGYSVLAGGKRLRPILALAAYEACGGDSRDIVPCASAVEVIHTYSLIHDDLPAMDNDDIRRGRPTNHKVYGEAMAILAGDALLTEAFLMVLGSHAMAGRGALLDAVGELATAAGVRGMVGGQAQDIISEGAEPDPDTLEYIHTHKTGALIAASVRLGGILAGADERTMEALTLYGGNLGHAFQIVDDVLDVRGDSEVLGKPTGSDQAKNKMTYPALYGLEESMRQAEKLIGGALDSIAFMGEKAWSLRGIADFILARNR
jgi:geranylgeranyl diphosphate synthase type II